MPVGFMIGEIRRATTYQVIVTQGMESQEVLYRGESMLHDADLARLVGMSAIKQFPNGVVEIVTTETRTKVKKIEVLRMTPMPETRDV